MITGTGKLGLKESLKKKIKNQNFIILSVLLCIVLVVVAIVAIILIKRSDSHHNPDPLQTDIISAENLSEQGELNDANVRFDELVKKAKTPQDKARLLKSKGNNCSDQKDYRCALNSYVEAEQYVPVDYMSAFIKANLNKLLGNKAEAKKLYQQAISLSVGDEFDKPEIRQMAQEEISKL